MKVLVLFCFIQACTGAAVIPQCALFCPENYAPVCGTNGKTYSNQCFLNIATCHDSSIQLDYAGRCGSGSVGLAACPDMMCMAMYDPVCGTDGITYSNSCDLHSKHCHGDVTVAHRGSCDGSLLVS